MDCVTNIQYAPIFAACTCGCNSIGWFVCGTHGWRSQYAVNQVAAQLATTMLNAGRITESELDVMWSRPSDWDELLGMAEAEAGSASYRQMN